MADLQRRHTFSRLRWIGGLLAGWGFFQDYDGLVQHKVLRLHQIRYHVHLLPYDMVWDIAGGVGLVIGLTILLSAQRARPLPGPAGR